MNYSSLGTQQQSISSMGTLCHWVYHQSTSTPNIFADKQIQSTINCIRIIQFLSHLWSHGLHTTMSSLLFSFHFQSLSLSLSLSVSFNHFPCISSSNLCCRLSSPLLSLQSLPISSYPFPLFQTHNPLSPALSPLALSWTVCAHGRRCFHLFLSSLLSVCSHKTIEWMHSARNSIFNNSLNQKNLCSWGGLLIKCTGQHRTWLLIPSWTYRRDVIYIYGK